MVLKHDPAGKSSGATEDEDVCQLRTCTGTRLRGLAVNVNSSSALYHQTWGTFGERVPYDLDAATYPSTMLAL